MAKEFAERKFKWLNMTESMGYGICKATDGHQYVYDYITVDGEEWTIISLDECPQDQHSTPLRSLYTEYVEEGGDVAREFCELLTDFTVREFYDKYMPDAYLDPAPELRQIAEEHVLDHCEKCGCDDYIVHDKALDAYHLVHLDLRCLHEQCIHPEVEDAETPEALSSFENRRKAVWALPPITIDDLEWIVELMSTQKLSHRSTRYDLYQQLQQQIADWREYMGLPKKEEDND